MRSCILHLFYSRSPSIPNCARLAKATILSYSLCGKPSLCVLPQAYRGFEGPPPPKVWETLRRNLSSAPRNLGDSGLRRCHEVTSGEFPLISVAAHRLWVYTSVQIPVSRKCVLWGCSMIFSPWVCHAYRKQQLLAINFGKHHAQTARPSGISECFTQELSKQFRASWIGLLPEQSCK